MTVKEIIESGLLEVYVLGNATAEEVSRVNELCSKHPELIQEIENIELALINYSSASAGKLSPALKDKISAKLEFSNEKAGSSETPAKVISLNDNRLKLYRFGLAASLLLFVTSLTYNILLQNRVTSLNNELAELSSSQSRMAQQFEIQKASYDQMENELAIVTNPKMKKVVLQGMNSMTNHSAAIHWNTETKEVYFNAGAMSAPQGKQYQLWAIVDGKPLDAGMIDMTDSSTVFQKMKTIPAAQAFAVTIENVGGSAAPTLETMCLLGNV